MKAASITARIDRRPAAEIILAAGGRFRLQPQEQEELSRAAAHLTPEGWERVTSEAIRRGISGLLCHHLRAAGASSPPELREAYRRIAVRNAAWESELRRLGQVFAGGDFGILLIKGAALQEAVFSDAGIRFMSDVDWVLRDAHAAEKAGEKLRESGYAPWSEAYSDIWVRGDFMIDQHMDALGDDRITARASQSREVSAGEEIWRRARASYLGPPFLVPAAEDHLLILCTHLMKHSFEPGAWFADLEALLLAEEQLDWESVLERAERWSLLRPLAYAFQVMDDLRGEKAGPVAGVPASARRQLMAVRPTRLDKFLLSLSRRGERLADEKDEWELPPVANLLWLSSQKGIRGKGRLLWEAAFPRSEVMAQMYPAYRPGFRWWYLICRAGNLLRLGARLSVPFLFSRRPD